MCDVNNTLRQKIKQSLLVQTDNTAIYTDSKNQSTEGDEEKIKNDLIIHKMQWMGTEKQLITLFEMLMNKHLINIEENRKWKILAQHFINKKGDPFNHKQLSTVAQRTSQAEGEVIQIVDKIAKEPPE